jgi:hypothetical protein
MTLRQEREERIRTARDHATHLLETASDPWVEAQVQMTIRDLDKAEAWLRKPAGESPASIIEAVDALLELVRWRLGSVDPPVAQHGPNVEPMG